jgi:hypothetical protein
VSSRIGKEETERLFLLARERGLPEGFVDWEVSSRDGLTVAHVTASNWNLAEKANAKPSPARYGKGRVILPVKQKSTIRRKPCH